MDAWVWILLVVIVVAIVAAVLASRSRQRENRRAEAADLRDPTAEHHMELREKEAAAAASEAEARRTRAEADQRAAEAQHLEVQAQRAAKEREEAAAEHAAQLRRADALDPDVRTDKEGYRLDENGNRVETPGAGLGTATAAGAGAMAAGADARTDRDLGGAAEAHRADPDERGRPIAEAEQLGSTRIGNMRDLDNGTPAPDAAATHTGPSGTAASDTGAAHPDAAVSPAGSRLDEDRTDTDLDEPSGSGFRPEHRIGNMRDLDDDGRPTSGDPDPTGLDTRSGADETATDRPVGDVDGDRDQDGDVDAKDKARERADDVLSRRDAERRQPE